MGFSIEEFGIAKKSAQKKMKTHKNKKKSLIKILMKSTMYLKKKIA